MNRYLVTLNNDEVLGFLETDKSYAEVEKIYFILSEECDYPGELFELMYDDYDIKFIEFNEEVLIID